MLLGLPVRWEEACFAVPAVRALEKSGLIGGLALREEQAEFWKTVSGLPQLVFSEKSGAGNLAEEVRGKWEASLVWEDGIAAKAFAKAKITKRLGAEKGVPGKLMTHPLNVAEGATEHRVRLYLKTCERMGVAVDRPEFFTPADLGIRPEPGTVLLCPGSDFGASHEWPLDRWQELGGKLRALGLRITVAGGVGGRGLGEILVERMGGETAFLHAEPLGGTLPSLAAQELTVAADGSLPHLAAHAGSTCVTLFGPNDAAWKRPLGKRHKVVKRHVECAPCLSAKCLLDGRCQSELEMVRVLAPGGAITGSSLFTDTGLRFQPLRRAGTRAGVLGPMCTSTEARAWLREAGCDEVDLSLHGALGYFRAVRTAVHAADSAHSACDWRGVLKELQLFQDVDQGSDQRAGGRPRLQARTGIGLAHARRPPPPRRSPRRLARRVALPSGHMKCWARL